MRLEGFGGFLRPTAAELTKGRFMRAPDHGDGGDDGAADGAADGQGSDGDQGGSDAGKSGADDDPNANADDSSLLGDAGTGAGDGGDGEGGDQKSEGDAGDKVETVPETYDLKLTIKAEDGTEAPVDLDPVLVEAATPVLKELKLSNEQANTLLPLVPKIQEQLLIQQADNFAAMKADWAKSAKADSEIGGKNWAETETLCAKALDTFGAPKDSEFRKLLGETGLGNHPEMIRMFRKIGETLGEGDFVRGDAAAKKPVDKTREQYPNDPPKAAVKE